MTADHHLAALLERLRSHPRLGHQIVGALELPGQEARYAALDPPLPPALDAALAASGASRLWSHQAAGIAAARRREHVLVTTPTASGKSLVFQVPVLEEAARGGPGRALFLYPLKALGQDQKAKFESLAAAAGIDAPCAIYDGDTPRALRTKIRRTPPRVLVSNPDMLHLGILASWTSWQPFLADLSWIVLDELHTYRGVFGSHFHHVLQRLLRLARAQGARPAIIASSATAANAEEFAATLVGEPSVVVDESGAPREPRHLLLVQPESSPYTAALHLLVEMLEAGQKTIVFTKARRITELLYSWLRQQRPELAARVASYRAGFLAEERRQIENDLFAGRLQGVIATSALEMGIDVGGLDACVLVGYPGKRHGALAALRAGGAAGEAVGDRHGGAARRPRPVLPAAPAGAGGPPVRAAGGRPDQRDGRRPAPGLRRRRGASSPRARRRLSRAPRADGARAARRRPPARGGRRHHPLRPRPPAAPPGRPARWRRQLPHRARRRRAGDRHRRRHSHAARMPPRRHLPPRWPPVRGGRPRRREGAGAGPPDRGRLVHRRPRREGDRGARDPRPPARRAVVGVARPARGHRTGGRVRAQAALLAGGPVAPRARAAAGEVPDRGALLGGAAGPAGEAARRRAPRARRAPRQRARGDLALSAARALRPRRHRRHLDRLAPTARLRRGLRLRRPRRRRRHRRQGVRGAPRAARPRRRAARALPVRGRLPVLRAVAQVRQRQPAARQGRGAREPALAARRGGGRGGGERALAAGVGAGGGGGGGSARGGARGGARRTAWRAAWGEARGAARGAAPGGARERGAGAPAIGAGRKWVGGADARRRRPGGATSSGRLLRDRGRRGDRPPPRGGRCRCRVDRPDGDRGR